MNSTRRTQTAGRATSSSHGRRTRSLADIRHGLERLKGILKTRFRVRTLSVFGSYRRGEQTGRSDVDILVEFERTVDLIEYLELENFLSDTLGVKVDLVMKDALKTRIRDGILREAVAV